MDTASKQIDLGRLDGFVRSVNKANSLPELSSVVRSQVERQGFQYFSYVPLAPTSIAGRGVFLTSLPSEWVRCYVENRYIRDDIVVGHIAVTMAPFLWTRIIDRRFHTPVQRRILREAGDFGINSGGTIPIHGPGRTRALLTVADETDEDGFDERFLIERFELQLISSYVHERFLSLYPAGNRPEPIPRLSPREIEVLTWSANGKTIVEIAAILSISKATCADYVKSACRKLHASNKAHAIAVALMHGLITP